MFAVYQKGDTNPVFEILWECEEVDPFDLPEAPPVREEWWPTVYMGTDLHPAVTFQSREDGVAWVKQKMEPRPAWAAAFAPWPSDFEIRPCA